MQNVFRPGDKEKGNMAELEPDRESVDSEKVQPGEKNLLYVCS